MQDRLAALDAAVLGESCILRSSLTGQTSTVSARVERVPIDIGGVGAFELRNIAKIPTALLPWDVHIADVLTDAGGNSHEVDSLDNDGDGMTRLVLREDRR